MLTVRYFAGARAAAGRSEERLPAPASLNEVVEILVGMHGQELAKVLAAASFLVDGVACHNRDAALPSGSIVDVLPPFAGG